MKNQTTWDQFLTSPWGVIGILGLVGGALAFSALLWLMFGLDIGLTR